MVKKILEIDNKLKTYNYFQECVIENIVFIDFGTSLVLSLNYIWSENYDIIKDINNEKNIKTIKILTINKFILENNLNNNQIKNIDLINWGFNEISTIKIYEIPNEIYLKMEIIWETNRKIIIDFIDLEIQ